MSVMSLKCSLSLENSSRTLDIHFNDKSWWFVGHGEIIDALWFAHKNLHKCLLLLGCHLLCLNHGSVSREINYGPKRCVMTHDDKIFSHIFSLYLSALTFVSSAWHRYWARQRIRNVPFRLDLSFCWWFMLGRSFWIY